jgi:hypothetical protein
MRLFMVVLLIIAPVYWPQDPPPTPTMPTADTAAQESPQPAAPPQQLPPQSDDQQPTPSGSQDAPQSAAQPAPTYASDQQPPPAAAKQLITLPAGTRIPLVLTNSIGRTLSQPGDSVRAATAFPVSIGNTVAIPLGTYAEGAITSVTKPSSSHQIGLEIHFTRLIFANGYAVELPSATAQAQLENPNGNFAPASAQTGSSITRSAAASLIPSFTPPLVLAMFADPQQQPPPLPPLPHQGPPAAFVAGAVIAAAVTVICVIAFAHHRPRTDAILAPGARIDVVLQAPLTLDADGVAAAGAISTR